MNNIQRDIALAQRIAQLVKVKGGCVYYVGGCVRDKLMGIQNKDIDIEVHGIGIGELEEILDSIGERVEFGKSFGIYSIKGYDVDIAMPRKEQCIGTRHVDFKVDVDPYLGTQKAAMRRDFTINALMEDVLTGKITDHFGGVEDLKNKTIRHVNDEAFAEDPLRVLRAAQFAARFEFDIAPETVEICRAIDISTLSSERIFEELKKALVKSPKPSVFFEQMREMNHLGVWFGEVERLIGVEQNPKYHSEGDVYRHTMMVLDEAAKRRDRVTNPVAFMLSALAHDFGKVSTTVVTDGTIHAYGHETAGVPIAEKFLRRITNERDIIRYVLNMTELHMKPNVVARSDSSVKSTNKMFDSAYAPDDLIELAMCDSLGKLPGEDTSMPYSYLTERLAVYREYMSRPYVMGRDLIDAGLKPDESFSGILEFAHKLRLAGVPKEDALKQVMGQFKKA